MLKGIDCSDFQGDVNWKMVKGAGYDFAFTKATEGTTFVASTFTRNWHAMKEAGLVRGAYHFAHPGQSAKDQANFFYQIVSRQGYGAGDLPLVLDLEKTDGLDQKVINAWTQDFMTELHRVSGRQPILYAGAYFYTGPFVGPLWLPSYFDDILAPWHGVHPKLPPGYRAWTFWQHTSKGVVPGITGRVDLNVFDGSLVDLNNLAATPKPVVDPLVKRLVKAGFGLKSVATILRKLGR